jgi:uncharacterized membrane protein YgdD (TMEM256/DUF423 family)
MKNPALISGAVFGFLGVALGAFGAHALEDVLKANDRIATWDTAVLYQFVHVGLLLLMGLLSGNKEQPRLLKIATFMAIAGILVFSGSLYLLSITGTTWLGAITPFGGVSFLGAWALVFIHALKNNNFA